jgi:hypothetical protein
VRRSLLILLGVAAVGVIAVWWHVGGQHWLAFQTGTICGSTGERYCYWSGFGSVFPWVFLSAGGILGFLAVQWRHVNCHEQGCWRVGRYPVAGGDFKFCGKHHPDWKGKHPSREHILERHAAHLEGVNCGPDQV